MGFLVLLQICNKMLLPSQPRNKSACTKRVAISGLDKRGKKCIAILSLSQHSSRIYSSFLSCPKVVKSLFDECFAVFHFQKLILSKREQFIEWWGHAKPHVQIICFSPVKCLNFLSGHSRLVILIIEYPLWTFVRHLAICGSRYDLERHIAYISEHAEREEKSVYIHLVDVIFLRREAFCFYPNNTNSPDFTPLASSKPEVYPMNFWRLTYYYRRFCGSREANSCTKRGQTRIRDSEWKMKNYSPNDIGLTIRLQSEKRLQVAWGSFITTSRWSHWISIAFLSLSRILRWEWTSDFAAASTLPKCRNPNCWQKFWWAVATIKHMHRRKASWQGQALVLLVLPHFLGVTYIAVLPLATPSELPCAGRLLSCGDDSHHHVQCNVSFLSSLLACYHFRTLRQYNFTPTRSLETDNVIKSVATTAVPIWRRKQHHVQLGRMLEMQNKSPAAGIIIEYLMFS